MLHIFGLAHGPDRFRTEGSFVVFDDMISQVEGIDGFVSAHILGDLPKSSKKILIDHASFVYANFPDDRDVAPVFKPENICLTAEDLDLGLLTEKYTAYSVLFPTVDVHITATDIITDEIHKFARRFGYRQAGDAPDERAYSVAPFAISVLPALGKDQIARKPVVITGGYPKFDTVWARSASVPAENIITYAPSPNDPSGNKDGPPWQDFMSINSHGVEIVRSLCESFPDYRIVFKPHAEEFQDVSKRIIDAGSNFKNFEVSDAGSEYWDLYLRTKVLVSDISSTAYSFAIGARRPVVFFSKSEDRLRRDIEKMPYCQYRSEVGEVARNTLELVTAINLITTRYDEYLNRLRACIDAHCVNLGNAASEIADHLEDYFAGRPRDTWRMYQMDRMPSGESL